MSPLRGICGKPAPMPERKGLDIVNPQTGEKVVVQHSSDKKEVTEGTKPLGRGPLPITNPNTGERLAFAQLLSDASQAGSLALAPAFVQPDTSAKSCITRYLPKFFWLVLKGVCDALRPFECGGLEGCGGILAKWQTPPSFTKRFEWS